VSGLTQVYRGTLTDDGFLPVANTLNTLTFGTGTGSSNTFAWDGTSNIVVSVSWSRVPGASTATVSGMKVDNVGFNATATRQRDNITPAAMLAETSVNTSNSATNRPRFTINGTLLCFSPRVEVVATVTASPAFSLSATNATICNGESTSVTTITTGVADYDTFVWSPSVGVSGNSTSGWTFNPATNTSYTLTTSQSTGSLCTSIVMFDVTVNEVPTAIIVAPVAPTVCIDNVQALTATGGTIGTSGSSSVGADTTLTIQNSLDPTAFNNRYEHYWLQMVFTQAELDAAGVQAGNIQGIKFNINTVGSEIFVSDFKVRMGATSLSTLTAFVPTGLTQVFSAARYDQTLGVNSIAFSTPYFWDGVSNIIVDVRSTGVDTTNNAETFFTATTDNKTVSAITSSTFPSSDAFAASGPSASTSLKRLNTTFDWVGSAPTTITWSPTTNLFTDAAATVAYVANDNATTVYFKSGTAGVSNYTITATSAASCSVTATTAVTTVDCGIPYANLQFPGAATITNCETQTYFARVYKAGVTEAAGQGAGIQAWIGRNTTNTDPSTWAESSWQLATFNVQAGNDDEYQVTFGPSTAGTYYVASRFVFAPGSFVYGGYTATGGGIWDGTLNLSAVLTVENVSSPTAAAQSFCNAGTVADLVAMGTNLQWYAAATGGTALMASTVLATGTYYVSQTVNSCESMRTVVSVTVNNTAAPTASAQTICNTGTVADLVATGTGLQWYSTLTGGTALLATTALATGDYFVSQTENGCESARTTVAVTVTTVTTPTGAAMQTITGFNPSDATIANIVVSGTNIIWYPTSVDAMNATNPLAVGTQLVNGSTYYAVSVVGTCRSAALAVTVTVTLGVESFDISSLKFYPNPVSDILTVRYSQNITGIAIYDLSGRKVMDSKTNETVVTMNVNELAASVYVVKVFADNQTAEFKIVKQ
jgi:hypothetical protein